MSIFKSKTSKAIDNLAYKLESLKINEYVALMEDTKKILWKNFLSGVSKGIGIAIGFSVLGAIVIMILQHAVRLNIPVIGNWIAEIVQIVETQNGQ